MAWWILTHTHTIPTPTHEHFSAARLRYLGF
ncbi:hypothetical protein ES708_22253 [subsurface metagenome]